MKIVPILGIVIMVIAGLLGLMSEIPDGAPLWHQLLIWAVAALLVVVGGFIYRLGGGRFRFRDMIDDDLR